MKRNVHLYAGALVVLAGLHGCGRPPQAGDACTPNGPRCEGETGTFCSAEGTCTRQCAGDQDCSGGFVCEAMQCERGPRFRMELRGAFSATYRLASDAGVHTGTTDGGYTLVGSYVPSVVERMLQQPAKFREGELSVQATVRLDYTFSSSSACDNGMGTASAETSGSMPVWLSQDAGTVFVRAFLGGTRLLPTCGPGSGRGRFEYAKSFASLSDGAQLAALSLQFFIDAGTAPFDVTVVDTDDAAVDGLATTFRGSSQHRGTIRTTPP